MHAERLALCNGKKEQHIKGKNAETRSNGVHHQWDPPSLLRKEGPRPSTSTLLKEKLRRGSTTIGLG
jgi:hypothetical protein